MDWTELRLLNGSQDRAFEELCCQLAATASVPLGSKFCRKGTPDGGVECYWTFLNGSESAWQAKFFLSPPSSAQWQQIDKSVKVALTKHPSLVKYTICLPIDRADPRVGGRKHFMEAWDDRVNKWSDWARSKSMNVEFEYWGQHELVTKLSAPDHRGRKYFWFSKEDFTIGWFESRLAVAIKNAGEKYSPTSNVTLPIERNFAFLGRTPGFYAEVAEKIGAVRRTLSRIYSSELELIFPGICLELKELCELMWSYSEAITSYDSSSTQIDDFETIPWVDISSCARKMLDKTYECDQVIHKMQAPDPAEVARADNSRVHPAPYLDTIRYDVRQLSASLDEFLIICSGRLAMLANDPKLLLIGAAGQGKTHLLCDIAEQQLKSGCPRLLLHGKHFTSREPWSQIIDELGLRCTRDEFIQALDSAAHAYRRRILIFIDALNEGPGRAMWATQLAGMIESVSQVPSVGIVVSCRTSYMDTVLPEDELRNQFHILEHTGFEEVGFDGVYKFLTSYGIRPTVPLISREFLNPLFLKLLCKGLERSGLSDIPTGIRGITELIGFFLEAVNSELSRPERLDFDRKDRLVQKAAAALATEMAAKRRYSLPRDAARDSVDSLLPGRTYSQSLFHGLLAEGVLTEDQRSSSEGLTEIVEFSFERFSDHLIASALVDEVDSLFADGKPAPDGHVLNDNFWNATKSRQLSGLVAALSIQIPERYGAELVDLLPSLRRLDSARTAFLESVIWRRPTAFNRSSRRYVLEWTAHGSHSIGPILEVLLAVATIPNHHFNARFLHRVLSRTKLPDRDATWSAFLYGNWRDEKESYRLVEWAWAFSDHGSLQKQVVEVVGISLAWFLTSSHRFLRDRATKSLVRLYETRIPDLISLLKLFRFVDDPYVTERLMAVAYGCAMRSKDVEAMRLLALTVYDSVFAQGVPYPHILLREHARGVVEAALNCGPLKGIEQEKVRPPYRSQWPGLDVPSVADVKQWGAAVDDQGGRQWAQGRIYHSVMGEGIGDFSIYVIGSMDEWSSQPLSGPLRPTPRELTREFSGILTKEQSGLLEHFTNACENVLDYRRLPADERPGYFKTEYTDDQLESILVSLLTKFASVLPPGTAAAAGYARMLQPFEASVWRFAEEDRLDAQMVRRWILGRIWSLGWTSARFSEIDDAIDRESRVGRIGSKPERIGKKYQWIAYYELLARLSDNFWLGPRQRELGSNCYAEPSSINLHRDIDPSNLLRQVPDDLTGCQQCFGWERERLFKWKGGGDLTWLKSSEDIPSIEGLMLLSSPDDESPWVPLEAYFQWEEPAPATEDRFESPRRQLWLKLRSYFVRSADFDSAFQWLQRDEFSSADFPQSSDETGVYLGEFFWSEHFKVRDNPYNGREGWSRGHGEAIPFEILATTDGYLGESGGLDCSLERTLSIGLPCKTLCDGLGLRWNGIEGHYYDENAELIMFDPSVHLDSPSGVVIQRQALDRFLERTRCNILWVVAGEKLKLGGSLTGEPYLGRLVISGTYRLSEGNLEGKLKTTFQAPPSVRPKRSMSRN